MRTGFLAAFAPAGRDRVGGYADRGKSSTLAGLPTNRIPARTRPNHGDGARRCEVQRSESGIRAFVISPLYPVILDRETIYNLRDRTNSIRRRALGSRFRSRAFFSPGIFSPRLLDSFLENWRTASSAGASIFTGVRRGNRRIVPSSSHQYAPDPRMNALCRIHLASREPREFGIEARRASRQAGEHELEEGWVTGNCRLAEIQCR